MAKQEIGHWKCRFKLEPDKYNGFVYFIYNHKTKQYYIGRKKFKTKSRPWKKYVSSSNLIRNEYKKNPDDFEFIIIEQYKSVSGLKYGEVYSQIILETPFDKMSLNFYIDSIRSKSREGITLRHKRFLSSLRKKYLNQGV